MRRGALSVLSAAVACLLSLSSCFVGGLGGHFVQLRLARVVSVAAAAAGHQRPEGAELVTDAGDPRAALYRPEGCRDEGEYSRQVQMLMSRALAKDQAEGKCATGVHYSWDCLRRLIEARATGRWTDVDSVMLPVGTDPELVALAIEAAPQGKVMAAEWPLMSQEFSASGSRKNFCHFAVAFPVSRPLASLKPPVLVIESVENSHTLGQILRTAYHFGVDSVVASSEAWEMLDARACRVAMGWAYHMDFHCAESLSEVLLQLREQGVQVLTLGVVCTEDPVRVTPPAVAVGNNWALVLASRAGSEGLSPGLRGLCHEELLVPQRQTGTMNLAHAAAICMYELSGASAC